MEPGETLGVIGDQVWQDLDRDVAIQLRIARAVNLAHPAGPESGEDLVRAEAVTRPQGQAKSRRRNDSQSGSPNPATTPQTCSRR